MALKAEEAIAATLREELFADIDAPEDGARVAARLGTLIDGTYRLVRHIGAGGMSDVFAAEHVRIGRHFAVKLLRSDAARTGRSAQRFRREARVVASLHSDHVVSVIDCGELADGTPYLVMELLDGQDLRTLIREVGPLPVPRAVGILLDACAGVAVVHAAGLVHRDLKPENLVVTRRSSGEDCCKVLDFGVAKLRASDSTAPGAIVGTVRYMAPEQLVDSASVGPATDVYALGAILYECLSGRPMHDAETVQELMYRVMNEVPRPLAESRPNLPEGLADAIARSIAKSPPERYASVEAFAAALKACRRGWSVAASSPDSTLVDTDDPPAVARIESFARPGRPVFVVASLAATAIFFGGWFARGKAPRDVIAETAAPSAPRSAVDVSARVPMIPSMRLEDDSARGMEPPLPPPAASTRTASRTNQGSRRPVPLPSAASPRRAALEHFDEENPYSE